MASVEELTAWTNGHYATMFFACSLLAHVQFAPSMRMLSVIMAFLASVLSAAFWFHETIPGAILQGMLALLTVVPLAFFVAFYQKKLSKMTGLLVYTTRRVAGRLVKLIVDIKWSPVVKIREGCYSYIASCQLPEDDDTSGVSKLLDKPHEPEEGTELHALKTSDEKFKSMRKANRNTVLWTLMLVPGYLFMVQGLLLGSYDSLPSYGKSFPIHVLFIIIMLMLVVFGMLLLNMTDGSLIGHFTTLMNYLIGMLIIFLPTDNTYTALKFFDVAGGNALSTCTSMWLAHMFTYGAAGLVTSILLYVMRPYFWLGGRPWD